MTQKIYDKNNVFRKIIEKTIPANVVLEDEFHIAFYDINPKAKVHVVVIPKVEAVDFEDFVQTGGIEKMSKFIIKVTKKLNLADYRLVTNKGAEAGQSVFHFHMHILSGRLGEDSMF